MDMAELDEAICFFNQKTAYEIRPRDWSSDVCSSDLGGVVVAGSLLRCAVEAFAVQGNAERGGGGDEGVAELVPLEARDLQLGFGSAEVRCERIEIPSRQPPAVEVLSLAADVDQAVDGRGAAEHLAARGEHAPAVQRRLGLGLVGPVDVGAREELAVAERDVNPGIGVAWPGLQQQDLAGGILCEPVGTDTTRRARAYDDVVKNQSARHGDVHA